MSFFVFGFGAYIDPRLITLRDQLLGPVCLDRCSALRELFVAARRKQQKATQANEQILFHGILKLIVRNPVLQTEFCLAGKQSQLFQEYVGAQDQYKPPESFFECGSIDLSAECISNEYADDRNSCYAEE